MKKAQNFRKFEIIIQFELKHSKKNLPLFMGCAPSEELLSPRDDSIIVNDGIEIQLADFDTPQNKVLILGAGESGKTTILRQIKFKLFNIDDELDNTQFAEIVRVNILSDIKLIIEKLPKDSEKYSEIEPSVSYIEEITNTDDLNENFAKCLTKIWSTFGEEILQMTDLGLGEHIFYFFNSVDRIISPDYVPTKEDIIKSRVRSTGISQFDILINGIPTRFIDLGGQKNERSKWINCFSNVTHIIYVISLSDFDQKMFEDKDTNRAVDSLDLFTKSLSNNLLKDIPIFFIMNKEDIFRQKFSKQFSDFTNVYSNYQGSDSDYVAAINHIKDTFFETLPKERIDWIKDNGYPLCATDEDRVNELFRLFIHKIIQPDNDNNNM